MRGRRRDLPAGGVRVELTAARTTIDLVASATAPPYPTPAPTSAPDDGGGGGGYTISGRLLTTDGRPVDPGVYNATCVIAGGSGCGPKGGDGGPFPVHVPPSGQHLDFLLCSLSDHPRCLTS